MYCLSRYPLDTRNVCSVTTLGPVEPYLSDGENTGSGCSVDVLYVGVQVVGVPLPPSAGTG